MDEKLAKVFFPDANDFYSAENKFIILRCIMRNYQRDIVRDYEIKDLVVKNQGEFLINWKKRSQPLSDEDLDILMG